MHIENHTDSEIVAIRGLELLYKQGFIPTTAFQHVWFEGIRSIPLSNANPQTHGISCDEAAKTSPCRERSVTFGTQMRCEVRIDLHKKDGDTWTLASALVGSALFIYFPLPQPHWVDQGHAFKFVDRVRKLQK